MVHFFHKTIKGQQKRQTIRFSFTRSPVCRGKKAKPDTTMEASLSCKPKQKQRCVKHNGHLFMRIRFSIQKNRPTSNKHDWKSQVLKNSREAVQSSKQFFCRAHNAFSYKKVMLYVSFCYCANVLRISVRDTRLGICLLIERYFCSFMTIWKKHVLARAVGNQGKKVGKKVIHSLYFKTISAERQSNKCKNKVTQKCLQHGNILNKKRRNCQYLSSQADPITKN